MGAAERAKGEWPYMHIFTMQEMPIFLNVQYL